MIAMNHNDLVTGVRPGAGQDKGVFSGFRNQKEGWNQVQDEEEAADIYPVYQQHYSLVNRNEMVLPSVSA